MDATNNIATDLFYKIRSRFSGLKLGAAAGNITINPEEARFFDFDYMEGQTPVGHVSISLAEPNSMKVYFSTGITESMNDHSKKNWYNFLRELRQFAKRRLMSFDTRDISKDNLDKRDYAFLTQSSQPKQPVQPLQQPAPVGESVMSESAMYGSKTISYQKLMDTRLIIKHSQALTDDQAPGARSRHISALFVENQDGERFKYPFIHLAGARAMQRHVANGGVPYDDIGKSIIGMSEEIAQLRNFSNYVVRNDLMNANTNGIVERSTQYLNKLREQVKALAKQSHYQQYKESFQAQNPTEVPNDVLEDFTEKFTVKNFKEEIKSVFPVLYRLTQEDNTVGYNDIVAMTQEQPVEETTKQALDPFAKFEEWAMTLGEASAIQSVDPEEKRIAVQKLQELVGQEFPVGIDGSNAIESLEGIIEDPELYKMIKETAKADPNTDLRGQIQQWLTTNAPDVLEQVNFGDYTGEGIEEADAPRQRKPRYQWQSGPTAKDFGAPEVYIKDPETGKLVTNPDWTEWRKSEKSKEYDTTRDTHFKGQQAAKMKHAGVGPKDFDTTLEISNPFFDPNGPDDESDPNFEPDVIEVGVDYDYDYSGEYRPATWGYHGGDPAEYPELDITINRIVDLDSGEDITKDVDHDEIMKQLEDEVPSWDEVDQDRRDQAAIDRWEASRESMDMEKSEKKEGLNIQEVAEFIHSFYDRNTGTFPKGPEGVAVMVGKKFGERAEMAARKMVERMAPQQSTEQNPELQELARIKQLSGM